MFEIGDRIKSKDRERDELVDYYIVRGLMGTHMNVEPIHNKMKFTQLFVVNNNDSWKYDTDYYRRKKLDKICSKLGIE